MFFSLSSVARSLLLLLTCTGLAKAQEVNTTAAYGAGEDPTVRNVKCESSGITGYKIIDCVNALLLIDQSPEYMDIQPGSSTPYSHGECTVKVVEADNKPARIHYLGIHTAANQFMASCGSGSGPFIKSRGYIRTGPASNVVLEFSKFKDGDQDANGSTQNPVPQAGNGFGANAIS